LLKVTYKLRSRPRSRPQIYKSRSRSRPRSRSRDRNEKIKFDKFLWVYAPYSQNKKCSSWKMEGFWHLDEPIWRYP